MRRPRCERWCRSRVTIDRSDRLKAEKPASNRRLFSLATIRVVDEQSVEAFARLPFDFAAARLRSGRMVQRLAGSRHGSAPARGYRITPLAPERAGGHARPRCRLPPFEL